MLQVSDEMWRHTHTRAVKARANTYPFRTSLCLCVGVYVALTACSGAESVARCECEGKSTVISIDDLHSDTK